jgi:Flp pilus assembly protein TadD
MSKVYCGYTDDVKSFAFALPLLLALSASAQNQQPEFIRNAQPLLRAGDFAGALAIYETALKAEPNNSAALNAAGVALDHLGRTAEARKYFEKLLSLAAPGEAQTRPLRQIAMSHAFDNNCAGAVAAERRAYEIFVQLGNAYQQGEMLNEAARVCIEAGDFSTARSLYEEGTKAGLKETNIQPDRVALWNFRLAHARARLAAREGKPQEAWKHVAEAKTILDSNAEMAKQQAIFYPYLEGYVALYTGDLPRAIAQLKMANQTDPFIQCLLGLAHEKSGQNDEAMSYYRKAATTSGHNPPAAYARWFTRQKLGE